MDIQEDDLQGSEDVLNSVEYKEEDITKQAEKEPKNFSVWDMASCVIKITMVVCPIDWYYNGYIQPEFQYNPISVQCNTGTWLI